MTFWYPWTLYWSINIIKSKYMVITRITHKLYIQYITRIRHKFRVQYYKWCFSKTRIYTRISKPPQKAIEQLTIPTKPLFHCFHSCKDKNVQTSLIQSWKNEEHMLLESLIDQKTNPFHIHEWFRNTHDIDMNNNNE